MRELLQALAITFLFIVSLVLFFAGVVMMFGDGTEARQAKVIECLEKGGIAWVDRYGSLDKCEFHKRPQ